MHLLIIFCYFFNVFGAIGILSRKSIKFAFSIFMARCSKLGMGIKHFCISNTAKKTFQNDQENQIGTYFGLLQRRFR